MRGRIGDLPGYFQDAIIHHVSCHIYISFIKLAH